MVNPKFEGFYKKSVGERRGILKEAANLSDEDVSVLSNTSSALPIELADRMIENVVGVFPLPFAIATNFKINGKDYLIPMVLEEPSVVAAASNAAKLSLPNGFKAECDESIMIGQIQILRAKNIETAKKEIEKNKKVLLKLANEKDPLLVKFGGGAKELEAQIIDSRRGKMLLLHLLVDVKDAMGANAVNTMAEALAPELERISRGKVRLRILSNLAVKRLARAKCVWKKEAIGEDAIDGILDAYAFAEADQFRCTTHNKGIMNGIDAVLIATGNDFRAVEAGAHSYASYKNNGKYGSLTKYCKNENGDLVGEIELPLAVGLVGGATKTHPVAKIAVKILGVKTANELSSVIAVVGLAQNFAALRALSTEGIQKGHMGLHARNVAISAGAQGNEIEKVAEQMVKEKKVRGDYAKELLEKMRKIR